MKKIILLVFSLALTWAFVASAVSRKECIQGCREMMKVCKKACKEKANTPKKLNNCVKACKNMLENPCLRDCNK
jgi:hypothetical protein